MINYTKDDLDADTYIMLRKQSGMHTFSKKQAELALKSSLKIIVARDKEKAVGMGRLIGDGAVICYIQDMIVDKDYRGKGIGKNIIDKLLEHIKKITIPGTRMMVGLMSVKGTESFYEKCGFLKRPDEIRGNGFTMLIDKDEDGQIYERNR